MYLFDKNFIKHSIATALIVSILVPNLLLIPRGRAEAIVGFATAVPTVTNPVTSLNALTSKDVIKQYLLDLAARIIAGTILRAMTNQVVGWIQGGSNVGFAANLDKEFRKAVDEAGGDFLNNLTGLNLCGDIGAYLKIALRVPGLKSRLQCTLTKIVGNLEKFARKFQNGGWKAFFALELQPQNSLSGAYLIALDAKIYAETKAQKRTEVGILAGAGFMGFRVPEKKCEDIIVSAASVTLGDEGPVLAPGEAETIITSPGESPSSGVMKKKNCRTEYVTKTPGRLVSDTLSNTFKVGYDFAVVADEINEAIATIVTALLQKLISSTFEIIDSSGEVTGGGEGLFDPGVSSIPITALDLQDNRIFIQIYENLFIADAALRSLDGTLITKRRNLFAIRKEISDLKKTLATLDPASLEASDIGTKITELGGKETILEGEISTLEAKKTAVLLSKFDLLLLRRSLTSPLESTELAALIEEMPNILQKLQDQIEGLDVSGAVRPSGVARRDMQELFLGEKTNTESSIALLDDTIAEMTRLSPAAIPDIDRGRLVAHRSVLLASLSLLGDTFDATVEARTREELGDILRASSRVMIDSNQSLDQSNKLLISTDEILRSRSR